MSVVTPKVLVIDDTESIATMMVNGLNHSGCTATVAIGGQAGLEAIKADKPDLILLDIVMPEMNGLEVLDAIHQDPDSKDIPVVMLTSMSGKYDQEFSHNKGALAYWIKDDVVPQQLGIQVKELLSKI